MKRGKRLTGIISAGLIGAGSIFGANMFVGNDMFATQEVQAAQEDVLLDESWIIVEDNGDGKTGTITEFNFIADESPTKIIIPASMNGLKITKIGDNVFNSKGISSVKFATGSAVSEIGARAFFGCTITHLELPVTLHTLGAYAFANTHSIGALDLSICPGLTEIEANAFSSAGITSLKLPAGLQKIKGSAFLDNRIGGTVVIPETVTEIGGSAFIRGGYFTIDAQKFEPGYFSNDWGLADRINQNVLWNSSNYDTTSNTPFLFDKKKKLICGLKSDLTSKNYDGWDRTTGALTVPSTIGEIHVDGFIPGALGTAYTASRNAVKSITFADGHTFSELPVNSLHSLTNLSTINNIPTSIKTLKSGCLGYNGTFENLTFPGVEVIETNALNYVAAGLKSLTLLSSNVQSISLGQYFTKLSTISLPNMVKDETSALVKGAPWGAIYSKVEWKNGAVTEAPLVWDITNTWSFYRNDANKTIMEYAGPTGADVDLVIPGELTAKDGTKHTVKALGVWGNNILSTREDNPVAQFKSVSFGDSITYVTGAFRNIKIGSLNIANSKLQTITGWAFSNCGLTSLKLPDTLVTLNGASFTYNPIAGTVVIPGNVINMDGAFSYCNNITGFDILMYREKNSDPGAYNRVKKLYKKASASVVSNAPFGAPNVGSSIYYQDDPQPQPTSTVEVNTTNNTAVIKVKAYTTNAFYIVKDIKAASKMPSISNLVKAKINGKKNPTTADMVVASTTKNNIQGGNGTYTMNMTYGNQNEATSLESWDYNVNVEAFRTLTYDANAAGKAITGTAPVASEKYVTGYKPTLSGAGNMTIQGYTFGGWNTKADGTGTNYAAGAKTYAMPKTDSTLYAKWTPNTNNSVVYNANGGKFSGGGTTKTLNGTTDQSLDKVTNYETPTRDGYGFLGWAKTSGATVSDISTVPAGGIVVYAVWKAGAATAVLDANGGSFGSNVTTKSVSGTTGNKLSALSGYADPTRTGYTFVGWNTNKSATTGTTGANTTLPAGSATRIYAIWKINSYNVTFDANVGKIDGAATKKISGNYNTAFASLSGYKVPVREGYDFVGWTKTKNTANTAIDKVPANDQTVYALWTVKDNIKVTFNANGGKFSTGTDTLVAREEKYGSILVDLYDYEEPERQYYTLKGWAKTATATEPDMYQVPASSSTVYAVWEAIKATDLEKASATAAVNAIKSETENVKVSKDGKDIDSSDFWVTKEIKDALNDAINNAITVLNTPDVTQEALADAIKTLEKAKEAFDKAKKPGTADVVDSVTLNVKDAVLDKGKSITLKATVAPSTAKDKSVTWKSSNKNVATVDSNGKVTGVKQGVTKITVTTKVGKKTATANVRVLFDDVKKGHTFYNPIYWAADNGVTYGVMGTNNFAPSNTVTRGQVIAFLYRMDGNPKTVGFKNLFKDVTSKSTFYNPILWGGKSQVVAGYPDGTFRESVTCTRGQIVAFIWRMAGKPEPKTKKSPFPDINSAHLFYKAILWASENKITVGVSSGKYKGHFRAQDSCTRGQMVAFLQRFAKQYPNKVKL